MPTLLGRDLSSEEKAVELALRKGLSQYGKVRAGRETLRDLALRQPELFFAASVALLEAENDAATRRSLYGQIVECPEFLIELTRPERFSRDQLVAVCRKLMLLDSMFDVRLARLAPSRQDDTCALSAEALVRLLDVLDEISPGPRLIVILNHLTRHADQRIAAKATLLLGRRVRNDTWVENHLASTDPRLRASVVEALWGTNTLAARRILWSSINDTNNRVVGNAALGLHLIGDQRAAGLVKEMILDPRPPFRWTAAWVMGKMGSEEFLPLLERAAKDPEPGVQKAANRALEAIRKPVVEPEAAPEPVTAAPPAPAEAKPPAAEPEAPAPKPVPPAAKPAPAEKPEDVPETAPLFDFDLHLDGSYVSTRR